MVMACNISNPFRDVTIELTAYGKTSIIFNQMPPGSYINNSWWLQIQGGQARLVITDTQGIHAGEYWWTLRGSQTNFKNFTLNVTGELCAREWVSKGRRSREEPLTIEFWIPSASTHKQGPYVSKPTALPTLPFPL